MANPSRKRSKISFSRFFSSLRSKRAPTTDSPLLVQTGFPTSLADLVVKHHLHRKNRRAIAAPAPNLDATVSNLVAVVESAQHHEEQQQQQQMAEVIPAAPEIDQRSDFAPRTAVARGVRCQAKYLLVMALMVSSKEVVLVVMLSAVVLLLLESLLDWIRRREEAPRIGVVENEVSESFPPIKGTPTLGLPPLCPDSPERCDLARCAVEGPAKANKKKHRRKLGWEKFCSSKHRKDGNAKNVAVFDNECSWGSTSSDRSEGEEDDGEANVDNVYEVQKDCCKSNGRRSYYVFFLIIVLSGLLGSKIIALVLTLACCFLMKITAGTPNTKG